MLHLTRAMMPGLRLSLILHASLSASSAQNIKEKVETKSTDDYSYWPEDQPHPLSWRAYSGWHANTELTPEPTDPATAAFALSQMGTGINLGNTFDLPDLNPSWLDFDRNKRMIDMFVQKGFTQVRIPVTWGGQFDASSQFTSQVTQAVNYALEQGLWVVVDAHHETWLKCCYDGSTYYNDRFTNLWIGIASHFASAGDHLIFGVLNEPEGAFGDWSDRNPDPLNKTGQELTRQICNVGIAAIRNVSATRVVLCAPNAQGNVFMASAVFPGKESFTNWDSYTAVTVHSYDEWGFCGQDGKNSYWDSETMYAYQDDMLNTLNNWHVSTGIPVHFGEYGVGRIHGDMRDTDIVRDYYRHMSQSIRHYNIPPTVWDDCGWFAMVQNYQWVYGLADAVLDGSPSPPSPSPSPPPTKQLCCWASCSSCTEDEWCNSNADNCGTCGGDWCSVNLEQTSATVRHRVHMKMHAAPPVRKRRSLRLQRDTDATIFMQEPIAEDVASELGGELAVHTDYFGVAEEL